jgi:hypothetical protein
MTDRVELGEAHHYILERERDGMGDSGPWLEAFDWDNQRGDHERNVLVVGKGVRCGSFYARTMQHQDWWLTTPIAEFLEISEDKTEIKFRTENGSVYTVKVRK